MSSRSDEEGTKNQESPGGRLPLDAKLLADAVIELNISRRSVSLYPPDHPIVRGSIERAFGHLQKLFEIRHDISLGVAADTLVIDDFMLDRKNPVFREFAGNLHAKGIAAIGFSDGTSREELLGLHELFALKELPEDRTLEELARDKGLRHITLTMIDFSKFQFLDGAVRRDRTGCAVWEDYVYGLLEGRLSDSVCSLLDYPEEDIAGAVNSAMSEKTGEASYDRVITAYIKKKGESRLSSAALNKFLAFVDRLRPELKRQFLSRSFTHLTADMSDIEHVISSMSQQDFERTVALFSEQASLIPETLKNLIDRMSSIKKGSGRAFDFFHNDTAVLHDIELSDEVVKLFGEDHFHAFVSEEYRQDLDRMLQTVSGDAVHFDGLRQACREETIDEEHLDILLELLDADFLKPEDYLTLVARLSDLLSVLLDTGRFEGVLKAYHVLETHRTENRYGEAASAMADLFFESEEFTARFVDAVRLWGRRDREVTMQLAQALRATVVDPLLDLLSGEQDPGMRKFLLSVIASFGPGVQAPALQRLGDPRWYVARNMLYLLREADCRNAVDEVRRIIRHDNEVLVTEALRTLLHFGTSDAIPYLKSFLKAKGELQRGAIRLAGLYRVRETLPILTEMLDAPDLLGGDSLLKIDLVKALAEIGDQRALPALKKISGTRALFNRGPVEELKIEMYRSLARYPHGAVKELLDIGMRSRNETIREICGGIRRGQAVSPRPAETSDA